MTTTDVTKQVHDQLSDVQERIGALIDLPDGSDHAVLKAEWDEAFDALRTAGLEADADHPIAARYRTASDAVNHANRSREFAPLRQREQLDEIRQALGSIAFDLGMPGYDTENTVKIVATTRTTGPRCEASGTVVDVDNGSRIVDCPKCGRPVTTKPAVGGKGVLANHRSTRTRNTDAADERLRDFRRLGVR